MGRATGEISTPGQTTVNLALGVSLERAKEAIAVVEEAEALSDGEIADRAETMLNLYNAHHPEDARTLNPAPSISGDA